MGASLYSWDFYWRVFKAFQAEWPRATELLLDILHIVPADVLIAWRKDDYSWIRFKRMVKMIDDWINKVCSEPLGVEEMEIFRASIMTRLSNEGLLSTGRVLDAKARVCS